MRDVPALIGLYLPGSEAEGNAAALLADPAARQVSWSVDPLPGAPVRRDVQRTGTATSTDGVFLPQLGPLDGPVVVRVSGPGPPAPAPQPLGPEQDLRLVAPDPLTPPGRLPLVQEIGAQSSWTDQGLRVASGLVREIAAEADRWEVRAACYGRGSLTVRFLGQRGTVPCDGRTHAPFPGRQQEALRRFALTVDGEGLIAYRIGIYSGA